MKAIVGMSGGVDSSLVAHILKEQGYDVIGISMMTYNSEHQKKEMEAATRIAKVLDVKHEIIDMTEDFKKVVISRFINDYTNGRTPNPCALCNREIKFNLLLNKLKQYDADIIATGHYANVVKINDRYAIKKSKNKNKDQSYLLYNVSVEQLKYIQFPLGDMDKSDTRSMAGSFDKDVSEKKDSEDLCFIKNMDYVEFIKREIFGEDYKIDFAAGKLTNDDLNKYNYFKKGKFVDLNNNVLGYHDGIVNFTIGQRKGLNIALGSRKYVLNINPYDNTVVLGDDDDLFSDEFYINELNFQALDEKELKDNDEFVVKVRYRDQGTNCRVFKDGDKILCKLDKPVRAITKGQSAVFYRDDITYFGGTII